MSNPDFIETKGSLNRVEKVLNAILSGNPILLEGQTGTSKTRTAIYASEKNGQKPIVMNFSSQTTIEDLIGRITKDTDSWGGFSFSNGPYTEAFMNGHCLILDEINLAYENVLQCIEASLDSGKLFLEISGSETKVVHRHPNFHLIATQNPLTGRFSQKRQFLSQKFRSRFQIINFYDIEKEELIEIAKGLSKGLDVLEEIIEKIVDFHFIWKERESNENQIHVFTIREISGTIKSMKEGLSPYESIRIHYGSRYNIEKLEQMNKILIGLGINPTKSSLVCPDFDEKLLFMTNSIHRSILNSVHLLQTRQPILITGPDGCGKTAFARWIAQIFNSLEEEKESLKKVKKGESDESLNKKETNFGNITDEKVTTDDENITDEKVITNEENVTDKNENKIKIPMKNKTSFFICNPEISISDIIGRYMPVMGEAGDAPIMWIDGPVVNSLKNGNCLIMDQINIAPSTILERMNPLYDSFGNKNATFPVQENSEVDSIPIHPNFRIIATSSVDGLNDISPALLNRFTIVYIDDQLNELFNDKKRITSFITYLSPPMSSIGDIKLIVEFLIKNRIEMTMSRISLIVKGFFSLKKELVYSVSKSVLDFCVSATSGKSEIPTMDDNFIQVLLRKLTEDKVDSAYDTFIFREAEATRKIMAALIASMIAGFHVVLIGRTGLGKTSAAIALSRLCTYSKGRQFLSFNGETQLEELFGFFTIEEAFRETQDISIKVADLVASSFKLNKSEHSILLKNIDSEVKVKKNKVKSQIKLTKNMLSLIIVNSELLTIPESLQSFWQTLFEVYITHPSEPLLLVGPSGFKTFLAKTVSPLAPVVYLHSDTTISSLIGQITLLDKDQARQFLIESLYHFAGPAPKDEFQKLFKEIRESESIDIEKINQVLKFINNPSFTNIVENVIQQLIDIDYSKQDFNLAFSNYMSIFKPGLITKYILKQNSLILRNIAQPSPTVLERLNELLSVNPILTLFEDTSNTFTPANNKIISNLSNNFRLIGICLPREKRGLSEAMLSRLTEISVPKYTNEDQEKVIDSILLQSDLNNDKSINLYKKLLSKVSQIFISKKEKLSMTIPFVRIIEIVRIAIEWRKFFKKYERIESEELLFSLALFRCAAGQLPFDNKKIFIETFFDSESGLRINDELKQLYNEKIEERTGSIMNDFLIIDEDEDKRLIRSTISNSFIPTPHSKLPESNICFTSSIKDLMDTIISASVINYPLILEGPSGSGKSLSFYYLSKCVDANVVRISISSSTTVEDLFGKYEPNASSESLRFDFQQTEFLNAIRSDKDVSSGFSSLKKQWIIIEELHLASASVLDSIAPVFNTQTDQIFLPDGTIVAKGEYFIVGLISQPLQNQSIINSSIIYKTRDYTKVEYEQIYKFILSHNNFNDEVSRYFSDKMFTLTSLSATSQFKIPIKVCEVNIQYC